RDETKLKVIPRKGNELRGVFSTRAPSRPNHIDITVVRLISVDKNILTVSGVDMLDGSPLLDIKPAIEHE
ncbi:tRNA (N6-threonylcarbamoyladenosine(37)-N6)-methyltransferase TrmO, partial [bacterium]